MSKQINDNVFALHCGIEEALIEILGRGVELFLNEVVLESDAFITVAADTNVTGWGVDDWSTTEIRLPDTIGLPAIIKIDWSASGDQEEDKMFAGDRIDGTLTLCIYKGSYEVTAITAEVDESYAESDEDDYEPDYEPD